MYIHYIYILSINIIYICIIYTHYLYVYYLYIIPIYLYIKSIQKNERCPCSLAWACFLYVNDWINLCYINYQVSDTSLTYLILSIVFPLLYISTIWDPILIHDILSWCPLILRFWTCIFHRRSRPILSTFVIWPRPHIYAATAQGLYLIFSVDKYLDPLLCCIRLWHKFLVSPMYMLVPIYKPYQYAYWYYQYAYW